MTEGLRPGEVGNERPLEPGIVRLATTSIYTAQSAGKPVWLSFVSCLPSSRGSSRLEAAVPSQATGAGKPMSIYGFPSSVRVPICAPFRFSV